MTWEHGALSVDPELYPGLAYAVARTEDDAREARAAYERRYGYLPMRTADVRAELEAFVAFHPGGNPSGAALNRR